ncbi:unnamed protein product, partial [Polarella glacialis]
WLVVPLGIIAVGDAQGDANGPPRDANGPNCPEDATLHACEEWCEQAVPNSRGVLSGSPCAHLTAQQMQRGSGPHCTCYDSSFEMELRSCKSTCPASEDKMEEDSLAGEDGVCFGHSGTSTCHGRQESVTRRFALYDVKVGEGFNLQREVFPRMGWVVSQLNRAIKKACGGKHGSGRCAEWVLVLPPWCRLAHWPTRDQEHVPWRHFFLDSALKSAKVPVVEFEEFTYAENGPRVDLVVTTTTERLQRKTMHGRQNGGFYGWANSRGACSGRAGGQPLAGHAWEPDVERWRVAYSGDCQDGVSAIDYRCAALADASGRDIVDLLLTAGREGARSVLVKAAEK